MSVTNSRSASESLSAKERADAEASLDPQNRETSLEPLLEVNENVISEVFDRPEEEGDFEEIPPKIFSIKDVTEPLTIEALDNVNYELGVINLCWPEITEPVFETRTCFPKSYYTNSSKERLLLAYAENFRRQFHLHYKERVPLLLQAPNECGLQKMVCTTIRPTKLCYADTNTWQGIASLVSDFFNFEPLTKPMLHPERIMSPYTAIVRRSGNCFELAHVCVSWLIGAGYDAYVAVGTAKRDLCMGIRYRTVCPDIPDETETVEEVPEPEEEPRYKLVGLPDLTSKFVKSQAAKAEAKKQKALDAIEAERMKKIAAIESPPYDEIDVWRMHGWVLVLSGLMGVEEPFFIEPSEGIRYPLDCPKYQRLTSVYNHENYYVNLQPAMVPEPVDPEVLAELERATHELADLENETLNPPEPPPIKYILNSLDNISYELADLNCWEHLLAGEPFDRRDIVTDYADKATSVDTEKHLDMPTSWVEKLDVSADEKEQRYPGSHKIIHYKRVLLEKFAHYSERDGVVQRVKIFDDYALTQPNVTYEFYKHRMDDMESAKIDYVKSEVTEKFDVGRHEHLIKHVYALEAPPMSVEAIRTLEFNYYARLDHLTKIVCTPLTFDEYYTDRADRLESRLVVYTEAVKPETKRVLHTVTETYGRNPDVSTDVDIWKKIFHIQDNSIELLYHYAYNFVTNNTRSFIKPNLAETGGKILFYPEKTTGYIADPIAPQPRPLSVYYALCDNMSWEYFTTKHIRDRVTDINSYLRQRHHELTEPMLMVALFDTERNEAAKRGWTEQEAQKAEVEEREKEAEIDPLAPYLARMFGSGHGSGAALLYKEATLIREQCINDFKAKQLARQALVQERFDKTNTEYKNKRLWYLANQFILTPAKETAYFAQSAALAFDVHSLEVRLTRHRDLSGPRFKALEEYLDKHRLLKEHNRMRTYYKR